MFSFDDHGFIKQTTLLFVLPSALLRASGGATQSPKRPLDLDQRSSGIARLEPVSNHRDEVGAHGRIRQEIAVAEHVRRSVDLDEINQACAAGRFAENLCIWSIQILLSKTHAAAEEKARQTQRLVVGRGVDRPM